MTTVTEAAGGASAGAAAHMTGELVRFIQPPPGLTETEFALFALDAGLFALRATNDAVRLFVLHGALLAGYEPVLNDLQAASLGLEAAEDAEVLVVVNPVADAPSVNLLAPIVVNRRTRAAAQFVIEGGEWPLRVRLDELLAV